MQLKDTCDIDTKSKVFQWSLLEKMPNSNTSHARHRAMHEQRTYVGNNDTEYNSFASFDYSHFSKRSHFDGSLMSILNPQDLPW